jgi:hypothetical protein
LPGRHTCLHVFGQFDGQGTIAMAPAQNSWLG